MTETFHTITFWTKFRSQYSWLGFGKSMRGSVIFLICLLFLPGSASADYYDGLRAFDSADYALAASEWHTAASQGDLTPVPTNLPKRIQQEIGRWADHPFQRLPAAQFDTARWEARGGKQWINIIFRSGPYAVLKTHSTFAQRPDQDQLVVYLGIQRLSAVASTDAKHWTRRTLGFSDIKPLRPSSTAIPIGDVRPQDLSVEYKWDVRIGSDERNFYATWRVTGVTEAGVTVNGIDFRLPAFEVAHVLQNRYRLYRREMTFKYVPVLGVRVEGEGIEKTSDQTNRWSGRLTDVRVSEEVLSRVRAAAL